MRIPRLVLVLLAAACAHHVEGSRMNARVLGVRSGNTAQPLAGARLIMTCPDGLTRDLGVTGSDGTLSISPSMAPALDCTLTVAERGYKPESYSVGHICAQRAGGACTAMNLHVVLERAGSAGY
jgi:hypothetical protein